MIRIFAYLAMTITMMLLATGAYAKRYGSKICDSEKYKCYTVKKGIPG